MTIGSSKSPNKVAVISGIGPGLGTALAQIFGNAGYHVVGLSRSAFDPLVPLDRYTYVPCDCTDNQGMQAAVSQITAEIGQIDLAVHNAMELLIRPFDDTHPEQFESVWRVSLLGAVHLAKAVLPDMIDAGSGTLILTGATAGIRGGAEFSAFASAKFALRGLSQSLAREVGPKGVHVIHPILDGLIWSKQTRTRFPDVQQDHCLDPYDIAETYLHLTQQPNSSWTQEIDLRPSVEQF